MLIWKQRNLRTTPKSARYSALIHAKYLCGSDHFARLRWCTLLRSSQQVSQVSLKALVHAVKVRRTGVTQGDRRGPFRSISAEEQHIRCGKAITVLACRTS